MRPISKPLLFALFATLPFLLSPTGIKADPIADRLNKMNLKVLGFSCSRTQNILSQIKKQKQYKHLHFSFAGRKAPTITGIRGCGYAWNTSEDTAKEQAMAQCKKSEERFGTGKGNRTCRFLPL
ncbi:MAG: hypothetical protein AAF429_09885 [Pseudomonadota bacterium]